MDAPQTTRRLPRALHRSHVWAAAVLWSLAGGLCFLSGVVQTIEQRIGLSALFHLRGIRPAPEEMLIVRIDQHASRTIVLPSDALGYSTCQGLRVGLPSPTERSLPVPTRMVEWPRCIHAEATRVLSKLGAELVVMDILLRPRTSPTQGEFATFNAEDQRLAESLARAGNVVLTRRLDQDEVSNREDPTARGSIVSELAPTLEHAAVGSGVFLLPGADLGRFDTFTAFVPNDWMMSSVPVLSVQAHLVASFPAWRRILMQHSPRASELFADAALDRFTPGALEAAALMGRQLQLQDPRLYPQILDNLKNVAGDLSPVQRSQIAVLSQVYGSPSEHLFNFYGPPGSLRSIGLEELFDDAKLQAIAGTVRGKIVLVGRAELHQPEKDDYFPTVFSGAGGVHTSGVELAATAIANLLNNERIRPIPLALSGLIAALIGLISVCLVGLLPMATGITIVVAILFAYLAIALYAFASHHVWLPVAFPIAVEGIGGIVGTAAWAHWQTRRYATRMRNAFGHFVPPDVVDKIVLGHQSLDGMRESIKAACLATDVERFVSVAEGLDPRELSNYLDRYFAVLFRVVTRHNGLVTDVVGDAMMAIWPDRDDDRAVRIAACDACLELRAAVDAFNEGSELGKLRTRIGLDWGPIALGPVGAGGHLEYRAIGDPVNASNRIQAANKTLGTRVLISESVIQGTDTFLTRNLGQFQLRNKHISTTLHELVARIHDATEAQVQLCHRFAQALHHAQHGEPELALEQFRSLQRDFPNDGPTHFYIDTLQRALNPDLSVIPMN